MKEALGNRLVEMGTALVVEGRERQPLANANELVNDIDGMPHAFVLACLVNRQADAKRAWALPLAVRDRLGGKFDMGTLAGLDETAWLELISSPTNLHRMPATMANVLYLGTQRIVDTYDGDASRIWSDTPSSTQVVRRFLAFHGAGQKIATMAANILVRHYCVPMADYRAIDISADVQVMKVLHRLGIIDSPTSRDDAIYAGREISPDFPGIFDVVLWRIGHNLCHQEAPECHVCKLHDLCPTALDHRPGR